LDVCVADEVDGDVDPACPRDHPVDERLNGRLVEGVQLRRVRLAARGEDVGGERVRLCLCPVRDEDLRALMGKATGDRPADRSRPIHHRDPALKKHCLPPDQVLHLDHDEHQGQYRCWSVW